MSKEWFISKCKHMGVPVYVSDPIEYELRKRHNEIQDCCTVTHVIEYSQYQSLLDKIAILESEIKNWVDVFGHHPAS